MTSTSIARSATLMVGSLRASILVIYVPGEAEPDWYISSGPNVPRDCPDCGQIIHFATMDSSGREIRCACGATFPVSDLI